MAQIGYVSENHEMPVRDDGLRILRLFSPFYVDLGPELERTDREKNLRFPVEGADRRFVRTECEEMAFAVRALPYRRTACCWIEPFSETWIRCARRIHGRVC